MTGPASQNPPAAGLAVMMNGESFRVKVLMPAESTASISQPFLSLRRTHRGGRPKSSRFEQPGPLAGSGHLVGRNDGHLDLLVCRTLPESRANRSDCLTAQTGATQGPLGDAGLCGTGIGRRDDLSQRRVVGHRNDPRDRGGSPPVGSGVGSHVRRRLEVRANGVLPSEGAHTEPRPHRVASHPRRDGSRIC